MAEVRIEHVYNCNTDTLWDKLFFDEEYNRRLFKEALKFPEYKETELEETDSEIRRTVEVVPELGPMPGPLKKLLGDGFGYTEKGVFDRKKQRYSIQIIPNKLADKITIKGETWVEPLSDGKCTRIFSCSVVAKIFGVGGMLEKKTVEDMKKSYQTGADFTNKFLEEKGLK